MKSIFIFQDHRYEKLMNISRTTKLPVKLEESLEELEFLGRKSVSGKESRSALAHMRLVYRTLGHLPRNASRPFLICILYWIYLCSYHWPNGVLYYTIDPSFSASDRAVMERSFSHIEENSCIRFVSRTEEQDYVDIGRDSVLVTL